MESLDSGKDLGPNALRTALSAAEIRRRLDWALSRFDEFVGVNNHMGSRFTRDRAMMKLVLSAIKGRGLLFVDSRTTANSVGLAEARRLDVPFAARDVFIDNQLEPAAIAIQLRLVEDLARRRGQSIAIGHPKIATMTALEAWIPGLAARGIVLVPLSAVVKRQRGLGQG
jgi:uncharacterized protein